VESDVQASSVITCQSDYEAVQTAATAYQALHGAPAPTIAALAPWLSDPIASSAFTISIPVSQPGQVDVAAAGHRAEPGDANCAFAG
jgi:hypothetical protein